MLREILDNKDYKAFNTFIDQYIKTHDIRILHTMLLGMHRDKKNPYVNPKYKAVHDELKRRTNVP
ncbi:hypothetical protein [Sinomicrobium sp. M5D2P9]